jgi:hypothetical protein
MSNELEIGKRYLFKTVTWFFEGNLVAISPGYAHLREAIRVDDLGESPTYTEKKWPTVCTLPPEKLVMVPLFGTIIIER